MKKQKLYLSAFIACIASGAIFVACSGDSNVIDQNAGNKSVMRVASTSYKEQLMYLEVTDEDVQAEFDLENAIYANQNDKNVDWKYFDSLYNPDLSSSIQVGLAYSILSKKDLISIVYDYPKESGNVEALKKYVVVLTKNKYTGYTLLYSALDALLQAGENTFVKDQSSIIKVYGADDKWHPGVIEGGTEVIGSEVAYKKVVNDYTYLDRIKNL
jgi:hypothetical protein